jgi:apolipoprotein N-acyltransferase
MLIARFLGGFPWNLLGSSQFRMVPLIQIASFTGIYGVSFVLVWTSLCFFSAGMVIIRSPAKRSAWVGEIILPSVVVAGLYAWGYEKLFRPPPKTPHLTLALIQPSIPQTMIWDESADNDRFRQLLRISKSALDSKPDVLLWPEAALPKMLRYDEDVSRAVSDLASSNNIWMIVGSDDKEPDPNSAKGVNRYFNSSFLVGPEGTLKERYCKRNLVIFGEYIPLIKYLPFLKYFTPIDGGFTPGEGVTPFHLGNLGAKISVTICFEDVFPHLIREYVDDDTEILVNLTNNGWFGEGAAQWQHGAAAVFRAVENGIPLVRCSNNGLTCLIDSHGRLTDIFHDTRGTIYGQGYLTVQVPVLPTGEFRTKTYYTLYGDVFGWSCVGFSLLQISRRSLLRKTL